MLERIYVIFVLVFMSSSFYGLSAAPNAVEERPAGTVGELVLQRKLDFRGPRFQRGKPPGGGKVPERAFQQSHVDGAPAGGQ